jgi:hypothetical protein
LTTIDIVNRGIFGLVYLIIRVGSNSYKPFLALFDTGIEINLLPFLYYNQNLLSYASLKDMTSIVYNGKSLFLIKVIEDWIYIRSNRVKAVFLLSIMLTIK